MISVYDQVKESVRKYEEKLKGKTNREMQTEKIENLAMNVIIEKNKRISLENKLHKLDVIRARKLKIKISEIFDDQIKTHLYEESKKLDKVQKLGDRKLRAKDYSASLSNLKTKGNVKSLDISRSIKENQIKGQTSRSSLQRFTSLQLSKKSSNIKDQQSGGIINLFDRFSLEELNMMQSNQAYYLPKDELKQLFRKYLVKKRLNLKDFSYQHFILKSSKQHKVADFQQFDTEEAKGFILKTINSGRKDRKQSVHLLTNPLETERKKTISERKPKIKPFLRNNSCSLKQFKVRQSIKIQEVRNNFKQKTLIHYVDRNYYAGIVDHNRAILKAKQRRSITQRNTLNNEKSIQIRNKLKNSNEIFGTSVQMAQSMRQSFLKQLLDRKLAHRDQ